MTKFLDGKMISPFEEAAIDITKICDDIKMLLSERTMLLDLKLSGAIDTLYLNEVYKAACTVVDIINQYKAQNGKS